MTAPLQPVEPAGRDHGTGFSHGLVAPAGGRVLFVAGQTDPAVQGASALETFIAQFEGALARVLDVVTAAGGKPTHIGRLTVYVTDMAVYRESRPRLAPLWRARMGGHYPAMSLVEVTGLVEPEAVVEIEATAVLP